MQPEAAIRALTKMFQMVGYASGNVNDILRAAAEQVVALLNVDVSAFIACDEDGKAELVACSSRTAAAEASELLGRCVTNCRALNETIAYWTESAPPDCCDPAFSALCPGAHMCIPMMSRQEPLGVFCVAYQSQHEFTKAEIDVFLAISGAVTAAVENAKLYHKIESYAAGLEKQVEERTRELTVLYNCSRALTPSASLSQTIRTIVEQMALGTNSSTAIFVDATGNSPKLESVIGPVKADMQTAWDTQISNLLPANWSTPTLLTTSDIINAGSISETLGNSILAVPLLEHEELLSFVLLAKNESRDSYSDADVLIADALSKQAVLALAASRRYEHDRNIAEAFQKSLLPIPELRMGSYEVAGIYQPAYAEANVGGDFYDMWQIDKHRLVLMIGDVSGKGLKAAVNAATLKYCLRAYSELRDGPGMVVARANRALNRWSEDAVFATLFYAELNLETGMMRYTNAGHEPPVMVDLLACQSRELDVNGVAVGIMDGLAYTESEVEINASRVLLMYTDGVSEAGRTSQNIDHIQIKEVVLGCGQKNASMLAKSVFDYAIEISKGKLHDDVAIVAITKQ